MAVLITGPTTVPAAGEPPKRIDEFVGRLNTGTSNASVALMSSPEGWVEPGQSPEFDEYTLVLEGRLVVESADGHRVVVAPGQAVHAPAGEWVRYSTPDAATRYVAVCVPAFAPDLVHRDQG